MGASGPRNYRNCQLELQNKKEVFIHIVHKYNTAPLLHGVPCFLLPTTSQVPAGPQNVCVLYSNNVLLEPLSAAEGTEAALAAPAVESRRLGGNPAEAASFAILLADVKTRLTKVKRQLRVVRWAGVAGILCTFQGLLPGSASGAREVLLTGATMMRTVRTQWRQFHLIIYRGHDGQTVRWCNYCVL